MAAPLFLHSLVLNCMGSIWRHCRAGITMALMNGPLERAGSMEMWPNLALTNNRSWYITALSFILA